jgi:hypothetical protein
MNPSQGYVFWEHTPLTIDQQHLPEALRPLARRHSQLVDRLLWAVPKACDGI